ncbi:MAG: hypothetical protein KDG55_15805 [Rhodocyclaceae bacterium]|nr:hypothetical protein [Rhodocyclaceae bacterium]
MPWHARLLLGLGGLCALTGGAIAGGLGADWHPLFGSDGSALVFFVSAMALVGSGLFPIVLARLADADRGATPPPPPQ